jgi:hypothetical protein
VSVDAWKALGHQGCIQWVNTNRRTMRSRCLRLVEVVILDTPVEEKAQNQCKFQLPVS